MSYVELNTNDLKRLLSIMSEHFGNKPMTKEDIKLRQKMEVMHQSETEWDKE